jgi:hypothetical protein
MARWIVCKARLRDAVVVVAPACIPDSTNDDEQLASSSAGMCLLSPIAPSSNKHNCGARRRSLTWLKR